VQAIFSRAGSSGRLHRSFTDCCPTDAEFPRGLYESLPPAPLCTGVFAPTLLT